MKFVLILLLLILIRDGKSTVMVVSGGELSITGAITDLYLDFYINYTANVEWVAMIWSQNEADTDVTLFIKNPSNPASPVSIIDSYLDQNSAIQTDNIQNIMPSISNYTGDISNGIAVAFKRDLATGDTQDFTLYSNSVIQVCFMSSLLPFKGKGYETGNEKACTYISLHKNVEYSYDRLIGNYAGTSTFGGGNLTIYATESTDGWGF